jgi:hypothetical protein
VPDAVANELASAIVVEFPLCGDGFDAEIVRAVDGAAERGRIHPLREIALALRTGLTFRPERLPQVLSDGRCDLVHDRVPRRADRIRSVSA